MIKITNPADCCGCTACASICNKDAITMQDDALGFKYPVVNIEKCIDCGLCEKVCTFNKNYDTTYNLESPIVYGARHKEIKKVEESRSGGAFVAISDYIIENGGVVYGAGYTENFRVIHKRATTKEERDEFRGSKYVQSDLCTTFRQIKQDLLEGRTVLFTGTPCQTSGLRSFISNKLRKNLFLLDIVCHGCPSPYIWKEHLKYIEQKTNKKITGTSFRDKKIFGWKAHKETFEFNNSGKNEYINDLYTFLFYKHIMFRSSCGKCYFTNTQRPSDITLADFWGWEKTDKGINTDDKGLSLLLINTPKGVTLFEEIKKDLTYIEVEIENCLQPNMQAPSSIHTNRNAFEQDFIRYGYNYVAKKYGNISISYKIEKFHKDSINRLKSFIKTIIRRK